MHLQAFLMFFFCLQPFINAFASLSKCTFRPFKVYFRPLLMYSEGGYFMFKRVRFSLIGLEISSFKMNNRKSWHSPVEEP